mmetsp:Transcript_5666/g.10739  ORF Transcript_5666/g.10739 Transcript_5666/m.10739 type:complete len:399 (+) Transcript_5666:229-1425(+)
MDSLSSPFGACMSLGLQVGSVCDVGTALLGPEDDGKNSQNKTSPLASNVAATTSSRNGEESSSLNTHESPRAVTELDVNRTEGESSKRKPMEPEAISVADDTGSVVEAIVTGVPPVNERKSKCVGDPEKAAEPFVSANFEAAFDAFLDDSFPSATQGGVVSSKRIEELRSELLEKARTRAELEQTLMAKVEEERRMSNEVEAALSAQLEAAKKDKRDTMDKLHSELVEVTRCKAAEISEIRAQIDKVNEEKAVAVADLNAQISQANKEKTEEEIKLRRDLQTTKAETVRAAERVKLQNEFHQSQLSSATSPGLTTDPTNKNGDPSLHATHLRIARMQRYEKVQPQPKAARASSSSARESVGYAVPRTGPRMQSAAFSEEVRRLRERWEADHQQQGLYK